MQGEFGEPWKIGGSYQDRLEAADDETHLMLSGVHCDERMERLMLCVNALAGIPSAYLAAGAVAKLVAAAREGVSNAHAYLRPELQMDGYDVKKIEAALEPFKEAT